MKVLVTFTLLGYLTLSAAGQIPPAGRNFAPPVKSPEISVDGIVTVRLRAPNAKEVYVSGFAGQGQRLELQQDQQGIWTGTTPPLKPDVYMYQFIVDGATVNDPSNPHLATSFGTGGRSVLTVPGAVAWSPVAGVPKGTVSRHTYHSDVGDDREFWVYTPAGYDPKRKEPYPILYLLHGLGDDAQSWLTQGNANVIMDNLISQGQAVPMIVVTPLGYGTATGGQGPTDMLNIFVKTLLDEVMPRVEREYNVSKNRNEHAIAGLSMGGAEATLTGLNHLDKFAWIGSFSGAYVMWPGANLPRGGGAAPAAPDAAGARSATANPPQTSATPDPAKRDAGPRPPTIPILDINIIDRNFPVVGTKINSQVRLLWIVCGTSDGLIGVNRQFKDWLKARDVHFTEVEVPNMAHVWPLWRQNLSDFVPMLFKTK